MLVDDYIVVARGDARRIFVRSTMGFSDPCRQIHQIREADPRPDLSLAVILARDITQARNFRSDLPLFSSVPTASFYPPGNYFFPETVLLVDMTLTSRMCIFV